MKKIILSIIALGLAGAGFFYWQKNQADVRELNKTLPAGVRVAKSLIGNEYKVVNKIDGYEFKVPKEWEGVNEIVYIPERVEEGYAVAGIEIAGKEGESRIITINHFRTEEIAFGLKEWAESNFKKFGLVGNFSEDKVGEFDVVKTREEVHLVGMAVYFFRKDSAIYAITNGSDEFIRYIITNGKW